MSMTSKTTATTNVPAAEETKRVPTAADRELINTQISYLTALRATAPATAQNASGEMPDIPEFLRRK